MDTSNRHPHEPARDPEPQASPSGAGPAESGSGPGAAGAGATGTVPPGGAAVRASGGGGGSKKGLFGCLGCLGIALVLLVVVPLALFGIFWMNMDRIVSPSDTEWTMVEPTEDEMQEVEERIEAAERGLEEDGQLVLTLTERDLNVLVARAIREQQARQDGDTDFDPQARIRIVDDRLLMDARVRIPETAQGVPRPLRGAFVGLEMGLRPRTDSAGDLVLGIDDVRVGRIPIPVASLMGILREAAEQDGDIEIERELQFIDPETGEIRIPASELADGEEGVRIDALQVSDGRLHVELTRLETATPPDPDPDTAGAEGA